MMKRKTSLAAALAILAELVAGAAGAEIVKLSSLDGAVVLRGELLGFDGETFRLKTPLGEFHIDALKVTCEGKGCPPAELLKSVFRISGSNAMGSQLMPALIEAFAYSLDASLLRETIGASETRFVLKGNGERPLAEVTLAAEGTDSAFRDLEQSLSSIGMASRRVRDPEAQSLESVGAGDPKDVANEHIVALDGLAVIVARANPVTSISVADLAAVFAGRITNWSNLGGPDAPIHLVAAGPGLGTRDAFETLVMRPFGATIAPEATAEPTITEVSDKVVGDPNAIGFVGLSFVRNARALPIRTECGLLASPDPFTIKTEEYPLSRRLYLYTTDRPMAPQAKHLVAFALSDAGQVAVADAGFVDQSITSLPIDRQGTRIVNALVQTQAETTIEDLRAMLGELSDAERLSTTLRFQPGVSGLEPRALSDLQRLATRIAAGAYAGRELLLIGFTDAVGRADLNRSLSLRRAGQVRDSLLALLPGGQPGTTTITPLGFGELSPVGCNETFDGRRTNRRVEVWLRDKR
jgi:phosphate transport system substrate-binding protein